MYVYLTTRAAADCGPDVWDGRRGDSYKRLVGLFSELPFEWMKRVIEAPEFSVPNEMER